METTIKEFDSIKDRILNLGSVQVILKGETTSAEYLAFFFEKYGEELDGNGFVTVSLKCSLYSDSLSLWNAMATSAIEASKCNTTANRDLIGIINDINDATITLEISSALEEFLKLEHDNGRKYLFILDEFEHAVEVMDQPEAQQIRGLANSENAVVMTITHKSLESLGQAKYGTIYFSNVFDKD